LDTIKIYKKVGVQNQVNFYLI